MLEEFENGKLPMGYDSFEMMFQWGKEWISIVVVPMKDGLNLQHYVVRLPNDLIVILRKNEIGEWEELKEGSTELARHLGSAIHDYYALSN